MVRISQADAEARHVKRSDYQSCTVAFIDCKKPGSHLKQNYSIIGPGVTSSTEQVINLPEAHGFNIGAAAMPPGITNNLHIHFTAEVFMVYDGEYTFRWGPNGENEFVGRPGDILSVPTWIYRGFVNSGDNEGWIFTTLGGDNTGGVIFHPDIIREAADYGLYLSKDNVLIDTTNGDPVPSKDQCIDPMSAQDVAKLRAYSPEEMRKRVVTADDRDYRPGFIDLELDGCGAEIAPVIGHGISQNRDHTARINNPHGFSMEWLRVKPRQGVSPFTLDEKMVVIPRQSGVQISLNDSGDVSLDLGAWDTLSIPGGTVRALKNVGDEVVELLVIVSGDHQKRPKFRSHVIEAAHREGFVLDAQGYVAEAHLIPNYGMVAE
ncbi:cupin domain-containing protein [uncultured Tateyamaria sp.]|uniref:cupin domain-containing protein n=1 Tax=uncultured Tateyamaria sp. TaxID=455651 RepID=UPI002637069A|nr:cupin domain-containing protein [uncultured Tateyamaria sp.]